MSSHPTATYRIVPRPLRAPLKTPISLSPPPHHRTTPPQPRSETRRQTCHLTDGESGTQQNITHNASGRAGIGHEAGHTREESQEPSVSSYSVPRPAARQRIPGGEAIPRRFGCDGFPRPRARCSERRRGGAGGEAVLGGMRSGARGVRGEVRTKMVGGLGLLGVDEAVG